MPSVPPPGVLLPPPPTGPRRPVGQTAGKGAPVAPKAIAAWSVLAGTLATQLPTALHRAHIYRVHAMRALR